MCFVLMLENMGVSFINVIMMLIVFLLVLVMFFVYVLELLIIGYILYGLVIVVIVWLLMGIGLLVVVGIKLLGLEFKNQCVEAVYCKELVYGEDDVMCVMLFMVCELFSVVWKNYFCFYFYYMYFNIVCIFYLQVDNVFGLFLLFLLIVVGMIMFGLMMQIINVFGQVCGVFQYLINLWIILVELMFIYKCLCSFEYELDGDKIQEVIYILS